MTEDELLACTTYGEAVSREEVQSPEGTVMQLYFRRPRDSSRAWHVFVRLRGGVVVSVDTY